jgi:hypothetical protein
MIPKDIYGRVTNACVLLLPAKEAANPPKEPIHHKTQGARDPEPGAFWPVDKVIVGHEKDHGLPLVKIPD